MSVKCLLLSSPGERGLQVAQKKEHRVGGLLVQPLSWETWSTCGQLCFTVCQSVSCRWGLQFLIFLLVPILAITDPICQIKMSSHLFSYKDSMRILAKSSSMCHQPMFLDSCSSNEALNNDWLWTTTAISPQGQGKLGCRSTQMQSFSLSRYSSFPFLICTIKNCPKIATRPCQDPKHIYEC